MNTKILDQLPSVAATVLMVLVVAACAIQLRGDEDQTEISCVRRSGFRSAGSKARGVSLRDL